MRLKYFLLVAMAVYSLAASARPAPWYWWVSKMADGRICMQTSPGHGWYRAGGPYKDSRCRNDQLRRDGE